MGFFNRTNPDWDPNEIPDLSFDGATDFVDIGFLGGDDHRNAFVEIFRKMLADNHDTLDGLDLITIEAKRPVDASTSLPVELLKIDVQHFAGDLYDSQNDKVFLLLMGKTSRVRLGMMFDNPAFWLEDAGA